MKNLSAVFEVVGYAGAILILLSFLSKSDLKMRILNILGSLAFLTYGLFRKVYPFSLMGAVLIVIHLYHLIRTMRHTDLFTLLPVSGEESSLHHFLTYYSDDIARFFPDFHGDCPCGMAFMIYLNATPVGIFLANQLSEYEVEIVLDYAIPRFRDYSIGRFLYRQLSHMGYHKAVFHGEYEKHIRYLKQMEFTREGADYIKTW